MAVHGFQPGFSFYMYEQAFSEYGFRMGWRSDSRCTVFNHDDLYNWFCGKCTAMKGACDCVPTPINQTSIATQIIYKLPFL